MNKVKIIEYSKFRSFYLEYKCFYDYNGCFCNISITLDELHAKKFTYKDNIFKKRYKRNYVFNVDGLESLEISFSDLFIENKICDKNESVKYFRFTPKNIADYHYVYELINIMVCLKEVYFDAIVNLKLSRSVTRIFYITELYLRNVGRTMYFLKLSENNQNFDFRTTNEDNLDSECHKISEYLFFRLVLYFTKIQHKKIRDDKIKIFKRDLIFIANLEHIKELKFLICDIYQETYQSIKMLFITKFYIELRYYRGDENISEEFIQSLKDVYKPKNIDINMLILG
ncbi:hypothetical protein CWI36_0963p0010 [Hamiltosporidium magnivora]|nr:hypothetical protein CWI36_0963p0010 [Hamiltosporidium magnivora]